MTEPIQLENADAPAKRVSPCIAPTARIAQSAVIFGDVTIGDNSSVFFNAVLRGDCGTSIVVGDNTNLQENVCLHSDPGTKTVIGNNVTVGHGAIVHGATIGDSTLIGMGAIVLNGARIGSHCLVAGGALVTGKADIPDGMMVMGSPAKATRPLRPDEIAMLDNSAVEYVEASRALEEAGLMTLGRNLLGTFCTNAGPAVC